MIPGSISTLYSLGLAQCQAYSRCSVKTPIHWSFLAFKDSSFPSSKNPSQSHVFLSLLYLFSGLLAISSIPQLLPILTFSEELFYLPFSISSPPIYSLNRWGLYFITPLKLLSLRPLRTSLSLTIAQCLLFTPHYLIWPLSITDIYSASSFLKTNTFSLSGHISLLFWVFSCLLSLTSFYFSVHFLHVNVPILNIPFCFPMRIHPLSWFQ